MVLATTRSNTIDLLIGPYRTGKTQALLQRVVEHCIEHPEEGATIVVPSHRYRTLLDRRLAEAGQSSGGPSTAPLKGFAGLRILTFYQCCQRLLRESGIFSRIVPDTIRASLVGLVLSKLKAEGRVKMLEPIAGFPGTPAALLALIDELQRSGMSPKEIIERLEATVGKQSRHAELATIYQGYWESLDQIGHLDRRRLAYKLLEVLTNAENERGIRLGLFAFDGFDRFNSLQLHVIDALAQHTKGLILSFDYLAPEQDSESEYVWKQSSYAELQSVLGAKLQVVEREAAIGTSRKSLPSIDCFAAPDRYFEMAEIAARIKKAIETGPRDLNKFLVVARSMDQYKSAVESAFHDAGVEYFLDEPIELNALPIVQFLLKLCSLELKGLLRADLIAFLRNRYFNQNKCGFTQKMIDDLDRLSRGGVVLGGETQWRSALLRQNREDLWQRLKAVFELLKPPKQRGPVSEFVRWSDDLIERLLILPSDEESSNQFEQWEQDKALAQFRNVLALLVNEQEIVSGLGHQVEISFADFYSRLERLVERSNFPQEPRGKDYVLVCAAELAPNKRFEQVFIAGLAEGEFPRHSRGSGFINSDEVENWQRFGIDIQNPRLLPTFELALFKSLIDRANKQAVLSYPVAEMSAEELTPSSLLQGFTSINLDSVPFVHVMETMRSQPNSARNAIAGQFWRSSQDELPVVFSSNTALSSLLHELEEPLAMARARALSGGEGPLNGSLVDYVLAGTVSVPLPKYWSPTRLSDYGKCPFRFWMSHVLKIKPPEEQEEGLSPLMVGRIQHKVLELFYKRLLAGHLSINDLTDENLSTLLLESGNEAVALLSGSPDFHKDEFWDHRYREIVFKLKRLLRAEQVRAMSNKESFSPKLMEVSFGIEEEGSSPPLRIIQEGQEVLIRGRVDRIDLASGCEAEGAARVKVVDYKSGSSQISLKDAESGRNLQLPLYVLAVENAILPKSKVVEAEYLSVSAALPIGRLEFENPSRSELLQKVMGATKSNVLRFVGEIKRGNFVVRPNGSTVCKSCDHRRVCRISEMNASRAAESDEENGTY